MGNCFAKTANFVLQAWENAKTPAHRCSPWFYGCMADAIVMLSVVQAASDSQWSYHNPDGTIIPVTLPQTVLALLWTSVASICIIWILHLLRVSHIIPRYGSYVAHVFRVATFAMQVAAARLAFLSNQPNGGSLPLPIWVAAVGYIASIIAVAAGAISLVFHAVDIYFQCPHHYLTRVKKDMILSTLAVNLTFIIGAVIFEKIEGWYFDEALFFCVVFFTTIGYGNSSPVTDGGKLAAIFYGILGMAITLNFLLAIRNLFVEWTELHFRPFIEKKVRKEVEQKKRRLELAHRDTVDVAPVAVLDREGHITHVMEQPDNEPVPERVQDAWGVNLGVIEADDDPVLPDTPRVSTSESVAPSIKIAETSTTLENGPFPDALNPVKGQMARRGSERDLVNAIGINPEEAVAAIKQGRRVSYVPPPEPTEMSRPPTLIQGDLPVPILVSQPPLQSPKKVSFDPATETRLTKWRRQQRRLTRSLQKRVADYPGARRQALRRSTWLFESGDKTLEEAAVQIWTDRVIAYIAVVVVIVYWLLGAGIFFWLEPSWSYLTAVYFCFVTITTTGFGDYYPSTPLGWQFWMYYTLFLTSLWAYCLTVFGNIMSAQNMLLFQWLERFGDDDSNDIADINLDNTPERREAQMVASLPFETAEKGIRYA